MVRNLVGKYGWLIAAVVFGVVSVIAGSVMMDRADADQPVGATGPAWVGFGLAAAVCLVVFLIKMARRQETDATE